MSRFFQILLFFNQIFASTSRPLTVRHWRRFFFLPTRQVSIVGGILSQKPANSTALLDLVLQIRKWLNCTLLAKLPPAPEGITAWSRVSSCERKLCCIFSCYTPSMPPPVLPPSKKVVSLIITLHVHTRVFPQSKVMHVRQIGNSKCLIMCQCHWIVFVCFYVAMQWAGDLFRVSPCLCSMAVVIELDVGDPEWEETDGLNLTLNNTIIIIIKNYIELFLFCVFNDLFLHQWKISSVPLRLNWG